MMLSSPENLAVWNRLGLVEHNGTVTLTLERFERALELARIQAATPSDKEGGE